MRVLCLHIKHFVAAVEIKADPELVGKPIVIGGLTHQRRPVFDCSAEAAAAGISPGLPLREAHHLCPEAIFLPLDEPRYARAFEEVLRVLDCFSPAVESDALGRAFVDIAGLGKHFGSEEVLAGKVLSEVFSRTGFQFGIGLANSKFLAEAAAKLCPVGDFSVVGEGDERDFLAALSIELLPLSGQMKRRLELLGLSTLGQVSSLAPDALASQFGGEGLLAHQLASGIDSRPVSSRPRPVILEDELYSESPLDTTEALASAVSLLLDRLLPGLSARGQVCGRLMLRFDLDGEEAWQEVINLKTPTGSKQELLGRIRRRLETQRFPGGVSGVHLALAEFGAEPAAQGSLPGQRGGEQESRVRQAARELKSRLGRSHLKRVVALDPSSRIPERRAALVDFPGTDE